MMVIFIGFLPFADLAYLIASLVYMFDYYDQAEVLNKKLLGKVIAPAAGQQVDENVIDE